MPSREVEISIPLELDCLAWGEVDGSGSISRVEVKIGKQALTQRLSPRQLREVGDALWRQYQKDHQNMRPEGREET